MKASAPEIPDETLDRTGWELSSEESDTATKDAFGVIEFELSMWTKKYEKDAGLAFANRTRMKPGLTDLPFGLGKGRVADFMKSRAVDRMTSELEKREIREVTVEGKAKTETERGETVDLRSIDAVYVREDGTAVDTEGWVGVRHTDNAFLTVGGVRPASDGEKRAEDVLDLIRSTE